jgi:hypothetical protein
MSLPPEASASSDRSRREGSSRSRSSLRRSSSSRHQSRKPWLGFIALPSRRRLRHERRRLVKAISGLQLPSIRLPKLPSRRRLRHERRRLVKAISGLQLPSIRMPKLPSRRRLRHEWRRLVKAISGLQLPGIRLPKLKLQRRLRLPALRSPFANQGSGLKRRQLLAVKCGILFRALTVVYAISVLAGVIPPQFTNPGWYLGFTTQLVNNGSIMLLALLCGSLGIYFDPAAKGGRNLARPLLWASRLTTALFAATVMIQLVAGGFFVQQVLAQNSSQMRGLERQLAVVAAEINGAQEGAQLNGIMQRLGGLSILPASITNQPLAVRKESMANSLAVNLKMAKDRLAQQTRKRFVGLAIDSLRIVITALAMAVGCQACAQWNGRYKPVNPSTNIAA